MFCTKCGNEISNNSLFCQYCGNKIGITQTNDKHKNHTKRSSTLGLKIIAIGLSLVIMIMGSYIVIDKIKGKNNLNNITNISTVNDKKIDKAISVLSSFWKDFYEDNEIDDKHLQILHTRIIKIDPSKEDFFNDIENGKSINYIVEFMLLSNYFDSSPYYFNVYTNDTVVIYSNGKTEVTINPIQLYRTRTYSNDFSSFVIDIRDYGSAFNKIINLD